MASEYDDAMRELRKSQNAMDCGSFHGRERTRRAQERVEKERDALGAAIMPELIVTRGDGKALPDQPAAIREFIAASVRPTPFTTADLPPIRLDMSAPAIRARVVREALADLAMIVANDPGSHFGSYTALAMLAEFADDATLDRLARMVR